LLQREEQSLSVWQPLPEEPPAVETKFEHDVEISTNGFDRWPGTVLLGVKLNVPFDSVTVSSFPSRKENV
jgi:hypothetical protein